MACSNHKIAKNGGKMEKEIQILLVDDHELVRNGLRRMLELEEDMQIVGDCASAEEALSRAELLSPDIVLMDIRMPGTGGIEACRLLKGKHPTCGIIMLTLYDEYLPQAIQAGAAGYLLKRSGREELIQAIRATFEGESPIDPSLTCELFAEFADLAKSKRRFSSVESPLSPRETQILEQIAQGKSNKEVAHSLNISEPTVKNHITSILSNLDARDHTQAVVNRPEQRVNFDIARRRASP